MITMRQPDELSKIEIDFEKQLKEAAGASLKN